MRCIVACAVLTVASLACPAFADKVTGRVLDSDGKPVAKATVYVTYSEGPPTNTYKLFTKLTTDALGSFTADLPERSAIFKSKTPIPKYYGYATVIADGFGVDQKALKLGANEFHLQKIAPVKGKVLDGNGKPVASAVLQLNYLELPVEGDASIFNRRYLNTGVGEEIAALFKATTGADGAFTLSHLPLGQKGSVEVTNPEYARTNTEITVGSATPLMVTVRPTAILTGKVVDESGKPVEGILVSAAGQGVYGNGVSGADGMFRMMHLSSGAVMVYLTDPKQTRVALAKREIKITEGQTTTLPDFVLDEGGQIEVTVLDSETGQPIPDFSIGNNGPHYPRVDYMGIMGYGTDKEGKVRFRVAPGENTIRVPSWSTEYPVTGDGTQDQTLTVKKGETVPLTLRLKKAATIEGTIVDENDKPLPNVHVRILRESENYEFERDPGIPSDAAGKWKAVGLARDGRKFWAVVDKEYEVVSPAIVEIDPAVVRQKPLIIKVKKANNLIAEGRILSPDGKPIVSVDVNLWSYTRDENGNYQSGVNANPRTDVEGWFRVKTIKPKQMVRMRPGINEHRYLSGGQAVMTPNGAHFTDVIMTPLTTRISGRVVDSKGKPVAGALVWSLGGYTPPHIRTDALGKFMLERLPADGPVRVTAGKGKLRGIAELTLRGGKPTTGSLTGLELTIEPIPPVNEAALLDRLIDSVKRASVGNRDGSWREVLVSIARRNPDRALALVEKNGQVKDDERFAILESFCRVNPAAAAVWGPPQCGKFTTTDWKLAGESELAVSLATVDPALANQMYDLAVAHREEGDGHDIYSLGRLIAASALLRRGDEARWKERFDKAGPSAWDKLSVIPVVARGDLARAESLIPDIPANFRPFCYSQVIREAAKVSPQQAVQLLEKARKQLPVEDYAQSNELMRAAKRIVRALGKTDPEAALKVARVQPDNEETRSHRAFVLAEAASTQKGEAARALWKEAADQIEKSNRDNAVDKLAALAAQCRANGGPVDLVSELWDRARTASERNHLFNIREELIYHTGLFDPAYARMLAESLVEFNSNIPTPSQNAYTIAQAGAPLVTSDPLYGLEQIDRAPDGEEERYGKDWDRYRAKIHLIQLLLLSPAQRGRLLYEDLRSGYENWEVDLY